MHAMHFFFGWLNCELHTSRAVGCSGNRTCQGSDAGYTHNSHGIPSSMSDDLKIEESTSGEVHSMTYDLGDLILF